ncbi:MAG: hypothetical protein U0841_31155 [Chloroflexia bacterium]
MLFPVILTLSVAKGKNPSSHYAWRIASAILLLAVLLPAFPGAVSADDPVTTGLKRVWERTDSPQTRGDRPFIWGPTPTIPSIDEPLAGLPGDRRTVLYWDKSRMEVNDPGAPQDQWYVTNGLLVVEMVTGQQQIGVNPTRYASRAPAEIPFGDLDDPTGPTFRSFGAHLAAPPLAVGAPVAQGIDRAGSVSATDAGGATCAVLVPETQHCVASPFATFLNQTGPVYEGGRVVTGRIFDPPFYATGLPITEAYWITVRVNGQPTRVLIQLFERRTLTYNPANPANSRVEMGNVGLEYYHWRYDALLPTAPATGLDPVTRAALNAVWDAAPAYRYLVSNLAGGRYQLIGQDLFAISGAYGSTANDYHAILLDNGLLASDPRNGGRVLAHEAQHAYDFSTLGAPTNAGECYAVEARGLLTEAAIWQRWFGPTGKPNPSTDYDRNGNAILAALRANPTSFAAAIRTLYATDCDPLGPGPADRFLTTQGLPTGIDTELPVAQLFAALR